MKKVIEVFKNGGSYVLLPHINCDGDAVGSCLALREIVMFFGGEAIIVVEESVPHNLSFLGGEFVQLSDISSNKVFDCAVAVDCGDLGRLGTRSEMFKCAKTTICIDHHGTNKGNFAEYEYIDGKAAATAEIIFEIAEIANVPIKGDIAKYLYTGIVTDTGGFRYSNTTEKTMLVATKLKGAGVDSAAICDELFENKRMAQIKIEAAAINGASFYYGGSVIISIITEKMLKDAGAQYSDADAVSSILRSIEGVFVAAVIKEQDGKVKISMRSKNGIDVSGICSELGGGGHKSASGAELYESTEKSKEIVLSLIAKRLGTIL